MTARFIPICSVHSPELDSSHVPMLSQPERVLDVIRTAAIAVKERSTAAGR
jgi:hypothetical protein